MTWWILCFMMTAVTIFAKWYFSNTVSRFRQTLSRQQRETLELKGILQDARVAHMELHKQIKSKEGDITRMKKRVTELRIDLRNKQQQANSSES